MDVHCARQELDAENADADKVLAGRLWLLRLRLWIFGRKWGLRLIC